MQSSKLEMGYNENNETNLCKISTVCVSSVFVPNVTCMMDVRTMRYIARAGPLAPQRSQRPQSELQQGRTAAAKQSPFS